jgi:ABC-2 type transport system ATP-binding protein
MGRRDVLEIMGRLREHTTVFYSTHILDDVQRVSDTVAILNQGRLIAQAPIEELLAGSGHATFVVELRGAVERARQRVAAQPWVASVEQAPVSENGAGSGAGGRGGGGGEGARWLVAVHDAAAAEEELLRTILAEDGVRVLSYGRRRFQLEDVFMTLIEREGATAA